MKYNKDKGIQIYKNRIHGKPTPDLYTFLA